MAKENVKCPYGCELQSETKIICALISGKNVPCEDRDRTDCALKDILLNLQAKEQELRELTERLGRTEEDLKGECTRCAATEQLDEQIEALQADLSTVRQENEKLKEVLDEIVEIARERMAGYVPSVVANNTYEINMDKILSIIEQAKGEE